ncbi:MAG TPA: hypothetical protein VFR14_12610, partial [Candidatus Limnocylindrales bacterium]|nr:hypothetical protein [Candidatus Limnocylindrales bacterium]
VAARGPVREVLEDPALVELGVDPPPAVRLRRALRAGGVDARTEHRALEALSALDTVAALDAPGATG